MSGVVKARVTLDLLIPAEDAERFQGMSLSQIQAKVEHANWMAGPVKKSEPTKLGKAELNAELQRLRAAGCDFDEDDVAELAGRDRWWDGIKSLDDMVANKGRFLADPGCDIDYDAIWDVVAPEGAKYDVDTERGRMRFLGDNFDHVVAQFAGKDTLTVYREVPVEDTENFIEAATQSDDKISSTIDYAEEMTSASGGHWSLSETTTCPDSGSGGDDVLLTAEVDAGDVDWFSTFQAAFSRPWELHVALTGEPRLQSIYEKDTGFRTEVEAASAPRMG